MQIRSFYPVIITNEFDKTFETFGKLGFEKAHTKLEIGATQNNNYVMKDGNGNKVDLVTSKNVPRAITAIRINVDDYEESVKYLTEMGFENRRPEGVETATSKSTMMVAPEGYMLLICEHIKN